MRQLVYQVCYTRYQVSFYLWWIGSGLKYCKVPIYYDQNCRFRIRKSNIKTEKDRCGTARYFNNKCCDRSNLHIFLQVQLIESVQSDVNLEGKLWEREKSWQCQLFTNTHPSKHLLVFKKSWRRLQDMSWKRLQHVFSVTIFCLPRCVEYIMKTSWRRLEEVFKTFWKTKNCYAEDIMKMSSRHVLKTSWRHILRTRWRHLQDVLEINKMFTGDIFIWQI